MYLVLFDLDGTLSDSREGILKTFKYTLALKGLPPMEDKDLLPFIGPPLKNTFLGSFQMSEEEATETLAIFRERYGKVGKFENHLYDGIKELLEELKSRGCLLAVATSKPEIYSRDIIKYFDIDSYFDALVGASEDDTFSKKADIMREAIKQCEKVAMEKGSIVDDIFMVGDRCYDMEGARELDVKAIGVTYGFGTVEELKKTGADFIVNSPGAILDVIFPSRER